MSRLTDRDYLTAHRQLRALWTSSQQAFAQTTYRDQLALHRYFSPALDEPDDNHLAHRRWISEVDPSLPQRAGRAYQRLQRAMATAQPAPSATVRTPPDAPRRLRVQGLARPETDVERIAQVIFEQIMTAVAEELTRGNHEDTAA